ncbi:MAG: cytochrome b [Gammaproteobacteria bacterium]|nr:cytochrome b [Gammaproteobacteria bacterium]
MRWRSGSDHWGGLMIALHWLTAVTVFGLFALGLWMTGLTYYDGWYQKGPNLHRGSGVLLFIATGARLLWRLFDGRPRELPSHQPWERIIAKWVHITLYLLLFAVMVSGYLISTADGRALSVFGWFALPATLHGIDGQEDLAGELHLLLATALITLALLHAGAALKHHFIDRDRTLRRMLGL